MVPEYATGLMVGLSAAIADNQHFEIIKSLNTFHNLPNFCQQLDFDDVVDRSVIFSGTFVEVSFSGCKTLASEEDFENLPFKTD
jgi:hypothetical protein